jgi:lipopolysaccharide/colanic/teichoic acid biosynthesis glycosyltransferase
VLIGLRRVGFSGKIFHQMKFRTMVVNNDHVLRDALARDPALKKEWDETQKLRNDPRLTRVGKWLRRTSVDELPQIFNVLIGQMSLVGPRPITTGETAKYEELASVYTKSLPGMTGLWQVSGRNDLSYDDRVTLDAYYVRNWSIWLDLYIVIKTVWVVLTGRGAY